MDSLFDQLGLKGDASQMSLPESASVAFTDYTLMVAALTITSVFILLVVFLTDRQRQRSFSYWINLLFLATAAVHFALLITAYRHLFFGQKPSLTLIILFSLFAAGSRTLADWLLLLRVRGIFPNQKLMLAGAIVIVVARCVLEVIGRVTYNLSALADSPVMFVVNLLSQAPTTIASIYPWLIVVTDVFFLSAFGYDLVQRIGKQRDVDETRERSVRWFHSVDLFVRESNILPSVVDLAMAIAQLVNSDPNKYGVISLIGMVLTLPFATIWMALKKLEGDPEKLIMPLAQGMLQTLNRPNDLESGKKPAAVGVTATAVKVEQPISKTGDTTVRIAHVAGILKEPDADKRLEIIESSLEHAQIKSGQNALPGVDNGESIPAGAEVDTLADQVGDESQSMAFKIVEVAADATTSVEKRLKRTPSPKQQSGTGDA